MSSETVRVKAKTNWKKSEKHALHRRGEEFNAPADWLPNPHLEELDGTGTADEQPEGDGETSE